jgi:hypothetical protein
MLSTEHTPPVEAFLLIEQPRQRIGHWTKALAALDGPCAPPVEAVIAYYDPTCDQALIDLQYAPAKANMKFVCEIALLAEVGIVQPTELSEGERVRFLADRLTRCTIRITSHRTAVGALAELVRRIKEVRASKHSSQPPPIPEKALARSVSPRGDTQDPVMLVHAKGTRDNLEPFPDDGPEPPPPPRRDTTEADPVTPPWDPAQTLASEERHRTVPMPLEMAERLIGESSGLLNLGSMPKPPARGSDSQLPGISTVDTRRKTRQVPAMDPGRRTPGPNRNNAPTAKVDPQPQLRNSVPTQKLDAQGSSPTPTPTPTPRREALTEPYLPTPGQPQLPDVIYARYLRSGRWVPVRVGALSLKGAALLAGAMPRSEDRIDVAFQFGSYRAIVRGVVGKVSSTREAVQSGAATFSVAFELDEPMKRQLTRLLTAAREAKVTIKPPPPRVTRRFPVEWQVALGTIRGAVKATALDVSAQGMFVAPASHLEMNSTLTFSVVLDDGSSPIAGRAKVVRQIKDVEAKACGLQAGFGLVIVSMSEADRMRWFGFLARIERRADKRVLIGADPSRLAELQAALASLGYAVGVAGDPGALVQLASSDTRAADAVLIDAGWLQNEASASLMETLFAKRNVPCVTMQGEVRRARQQIDRLLEVVV